MGRLKGYVRELYDENAKMRAIILAYRKYLHEKKLCGCFTQNGAEVVPDVDDRPDPL